LRALEDISLNDADLALRARQAWHEAETRALKEQARRDKERERELAARAKRGGMPAAIGRAR